MLTDARFATGTMFVWIGAVLSAFVAIGGTSDNAYIRWSVGPSASLKFIGLAIDTWTAWGCLCAAVAVDTVINVWAGEMIGPWLTFNIYDKARPTMEYNYWTAQCITLGWNTYHNLRPMLTVYLAFTQVDILLVRMLADLAISLCTVHMYIRHKLNVVANRAKSTDCINVDNVPDPEEQDSLITIHVL